MAEVPARPKRRSRRNSRRPLQAVTIDDVAAAAGVSRMTVSRVMRGGFLVKPHLQVRVQEAATKLGYRLNTAARALAGSGPLRMGFVYSNPSQSFLAELLTGALAESSALGIQLTLTAEACNVDGTKEIAALLDSGVRLFLLPSPACDDPEILKLLRAENARWAAISPADPDAHEISVSADHYDVAKQMTDALVALGHRCIGFIAGPVSSKGSTERLRGHRDALDRAGLPVGPIVYGQNTFQSGLEAAERLLADAADCTAIVACNDEMAAAAISIARRRGLAVPRDLTVVGFDDTPIASIIHPALTTARQPISEMARAAIQLLHVTTLPGTPERRIAQRILRCNLVTRESAARCKERHH